MDTPALEIRGLNSGYGKKRIVADLDLSIDSYRITSLIGRNGVGKTTALKTIMGIISAASGSIKYMGEEITHSRTHDLVKKGISYVPQGKSIFPHMSVNEHLDIGGVSLLDKEKREKIRSKVIELFPKLRERKYQKAGTLSGGERQMLSIGRALMSGPKLLLLDEPSFGLAPNIVDNVFESIKQINQEGVTVLVVEQNANKALMNSTYGFVMDMGKIIFEGESEKLMNDKNIKDAYLGG